MREQTLNNLSPFLFIHLNQPLRPRPIRALIHPLQMMQMRRHIQIPSPTALVRLQHAVPAHGEVARLYVGQPGAPGRCGALARVPDRVGANIVLVDERLAQRGRQLVMRGTCVRKVGVAAVARRGQRVRS